MLFLLLLYLLKILFMLDDVLKVLCNIILRIIFHFLIILIL